MAKLMAAFPSKYLTASDVGDDLVSATIREIKQERMNDGDLVNVAYFHENLDKEGKNKGMILNMGNSTLVMGISGEDDTDNIKDVPVVIFTAPTTKKDGSPTMGLRLKKGAAKSKAMAAAANDAVQAAGEINF